MCGGLQKEFLDDIMPRFATQVRRDMGLYVQVTTYTRIVKEKAP